MAPWTDTTYRIAIIATLNNAQQTRDGTITFDVTIFNDCENDSIAFNAALPVEQTIYLASGLEVITFDPQLSQFNRACPRSCSYALSDPTYDSVVVAFDDYTGAAQFASDAL